MGDIAGTSSVAPLTEATSTQPRRLEVEEATSWVLCSILQFNRLDFIRLSVRDLFTKDLSNLSFYCGSKDLEPIPAQLHGMFLFGRYEHQRKAIPSRPQLTCALVEKSPGIERQSETGTPSVISLDDSFYEDSNIQISSDITDEPDDVSFTSDDDPFVDALTSPEVESFVISDPPNDGTRLLKVLPRILSFVVDALWGELPHLSPIYDLLPTENTDDLCEHDLWNADFDWTPFHAYARRVKRFSFTHWPGQLSPQILYSLKEILPEPLLPNVQSVAVAVVEDHSALELLYFLKFIPPTVSRLTIKGVPGPSAKGHSAAITLLRVMGKTPSYCTDAFTDLNISAAFSPRLWQQLLFKNLKNLSITVVDGDIPIEPIQRLASLPSMLTLELSLGPLASTSGHYPVNSVVPCKADFKQLEVVRLSGCSTNVGAIVLLGAKFGRPIHTMDLTYTQGTVPANEDISFIMSFFPNMRQLTICAVPSLLSNSLLTCSSHHGSGEGIVQESNAVVRHSPHAPQVPSLRLGGDSWLVFKSSDIERVEFFGVQILTKCANIASIFETRSGFNNLHTFRLTCSNVEETLTLKTLGVFSSKLPQLKTLSLYVDWGGQDEDELQLQIDESENRPAHELKTLFINNANDAFNRIQGYVPCWRVHPQHVPLLDEGWDVQTT